MDALVNIADELFDRLPLPDSLLTRIERERFVGTGEAGEGLFATFWQVEQACKKEWKTEPRFFELPFGPFPRDRVHYPDPSLAEPVPLSGEKGTFFLKGVVDRLEVASGKGFLIIDYKTGAPPRFGDIQKGEYLQLPLYLAAMRQALGVLGLENRPLGAVIFQVSEKAVQRNLLFADPEAPIPVDKKTPVPASPQMPEATLEAFLQKQIDTASGYVQAIREGRFSHTEDLKACERCPFRPTCRVSTLRS